MNIVQFKMKLVEDLVGRSIDKTYSKAREEEENSTPQSTSKVGYGRGVHTVH
jgi:hypothetical protein